MDRHKGGTYICTANNGVGQTASSQIALHVLCKWKEMFKYFTKSSRRRRLHPLNTTEMNHISGTVIPRGSQWKFMTSYRALDKWRLSHSPRDNIHNTSFVSTEASTAHTIHCPLRYCKYVLGDNVCRRIKCVCQRRWAELEKKRSLWQINCFELNVFFVFRARHKIAFNLFTLNFLSFNPFSAKVPFCGRLPSGAFLEVRLQICCRRGDNPGN